MSTQPEPFTSVTDYLPSCLPSCLPSYLIDQAYDDGASAFRFVVDRAGRTVCRFTGKATGGSARAFVDNLGEAMSRLGDTHEISALVDVSRTGGADLRAQMVFGRGLFRHRKSAGRIAIFGGRPIDVRIAKSIAVVAGMSSVAFFQRESEALDWLSWKHAPDA